eukprot:6193127-Pleurochrysis_carterae.AAC.3
MLFLYVEAGVRLLGRTVEQPHVLISYGYSSCWPQLVNIGDTTFANRCAQQRIAAAFLVHRRRSMHQETPPTSARIDLIKPDEPADLESEQRRVAVLWTVRRSCHPRDARPYPVTHVCRSTAQAREHGSRVSLSQRAQKLAQRQRAGPEAGCACGGGGGTARGPCGSMVATR